MGLSHATLPDCLVRLIFEEAGISLLRRAGVRHLIEDWKSFDFAGQFRTDIKIPRLTFGKRVC